LKAWDPVSAKLVWQSAPMPWWSGGVLTTAGNLVFHGGTDGKLRIYQANTDRLLREIATGLALMAPPITYQIADKQYVAVVAGLGGAMNARIFPGFAANEFVNRERVLVFGLDGNTVDLPPRAPALPQQPIDVSLFETDATTIAGGRERFNQYCARCHVPGGASNNTNGYPNLWNMAPGLHQAFDAIVLDGALSDAGMASFRDVLTTEDTKAIRAYITADRQARRGGAAWAPSQPP
jgi:quinohemoprotein ethanol dehydrogenase